MLNGKRVIALCISRLYDNEHHKFVVQLNEKFKKENISLWIYNINTDLYWEEENLHAESSVFDLLDFDILDAVIIMDENIKSRTVSLKIIGNAKEKDVPVITVDAEYPECSSVCYDYRSGFEKVVRHIIEEHHVKKPHFMGGMKGNPFSDERLAVFRKIVEKNGIPFDEKTMVSYGMFWAKPAAEIAQKIVDSGNLPDAIICANDIMAINTVSTLIRNGISVPEQVIVTGFDGIDEIYFSSPQITSARCICSGLVEPVYHVTKSALERPEEIVRDYVKPILLYNDSCGCGMKKEKDRIFNFNDRFYRYQDDTQILYSISEMMQSSRTIEEASDCLTCDQIQNVAFIINKFCTDDSVNHFEMEVEESFEETMYLFFDTDPNGFEHEEFQRKDIIPNLDEIMEKGYPLIFNAVSFMGVPLGYLCFHFEDYELTNYCKMPQIMNILSQGLGGFMNWQYQHYLMKQLEFTYRYDALTGLLNRLCFNKEFTALKESLNGKETPMEVILSDLDGLKKINDQFGHHAGDHAIRIAAQALKQACPENALCVRFGGDEMVAVIAGEYDLQDLIASVHRYLKEYNETSGLEYKISSSVGGYTGILTADTDFGQMIRKADAAMYAQKENKKRRNKLILD